MIYHTDVIEGLKKVKSDSVDCIILDPPYNIGKNYGNNKTKLEMSEYVLWAQQWLVECERILKPNGTMYVYGFSEVLAHLSVAIGLNQRWLIWHYTNKTTPSLNFWQRTHESILCCWKEDKTFFRDQVRVPYTDRFIKGYKGKNRKRPSTKGRFSKKGQEIETVYTVNDKGALPRDVICSPSLAGGGGSKERFFYSPSMSKLITSRQKKEMKAQGADIGDLISHPTQKPIKVTETLLDACIEEGQIASVVIPFAGTGSECFVCEQRGYEWTAFEINEDYVKMGNLLVKNGFPKNDKQKKE
jgi:site-specific DNA-methyltransferase (adenine-specific)